MAEIKISEPISDHYISEVPPPPPAAPAPSSGSRLLTRNGAGDFAVGFFGALMAFWLMVFTLDPIFQIINLVIDIDEPGQFLIIGAITIFIVTMIFRRRYRFIGYGTLTAAVIAAITIGFLVMMFIMY